MPFAKWDPPSPRMRGVQVQSCLLFLVRWGWLLTSLLLLWLGNISLEKSKRKKPCAWLSDQGWEDIILLSEMFPDSFGSLPDDVEKHVTVWQEVSPCSVSPPSLPWMSLISILNL